MTEELAAAKADAIARVRNALGAGRLLHRHLVALTYPEHPGLVFVSSGARGGLPRVSRWWVVDTDRDTVRPARGSTSATDAIGATEILLGGQSIFLT